MYITDMLEIAKSSNCKPGLKIGTIPVSSMDVETPEGTAEVEGETTGMGHLLAFETCL